MSEQSQRWASTMGGHRSYGASVRTPHLPAVEFEAALEVLDRLARETEEERLLAPGATKSYGAGNRGVEEAPDPWRTCFERDRDRILHSTAFRRLAGKTQVFIFPADHQRTRLTHALEVAQVATAISRACRLNVALTEAIALGHDCGHGPGGHASEEALSPFLDEGFDHAVWGADVTAAPLNLCAETLDGIRNHSWSRPSPATPEGEVVALADRIAYSAHDLEDAVHAEIVSADELPPLVAERCGTRRGRLLDSFVTDVVSTTLRVRRGRDQRTDGRSARSPPPLQLRAHLPSSRVARTVRESRRSPARPGCSLRRSPEVAPRWGRHGTGWLRDRACRRRVRERNDRPVRLHQSRGTTRLVTSALVGATDPLRILGFLHHASMPVERCP